MTYKEHIALVAALRETMQHTAIGEDYCEGWQAGVSAAAHRIADKMQLQIEEFDRGAFLEACGVSP